MQIISVAWKPQEDGTFVSGLRVWGDGDEPEFIPIIPQSHISWIFHGPRRCVGRTDSDLKSVRCPEDSLVFQRGKVKCGPCSAEDFVDPCIRCDGRDCQATVDRRTQCESAIYVVYLVVFNDETLKIGVSSEKRVRTRWVEQGADYGGILRHLQGGLDARLIEDRLGKNPRVSKQVRGERKIRALLKKIDLESAQQIVEDFLLDVNMAELGMTLELEDLSKYYSLVHVDKKPTLWKTRAEKVDNRHLVGEVVGMKGSLLGTRIGSEYTIADLKQVIGYSLDYDEDITVITQTGLLDFC
ncbi:MAG: DUF2797 domain-containing protein [Promethearchaeota archaeon]